jgi:hypothetical protein
MTITFAELHTGTVGEVMTPGVLTCLPVTPLRGVARMMPLPSSPSHPTWRSSTQRS